MVSWSYAEGSADEAIEALVRAPEGSHAYTTYNFVEVGAFFCGDGNPVGDFPWPVTTTGR